MRRWAILGLGLIFLAAGSQPAAADTRQAQVAGQFYPAKAEELRALVAHLLEASGNAVLPGKPRILIAPHAGYPYSGSIAAAGFRQLKGKTYEGVVVVGFTHRLSFESSSADHAEVYETPLGRIPIDTRAVRFLEGQGGGVRHHAEAHEAGEHSLEVELPFLQVALGEFKLIPILMGGATLAHAQGLADALAALAKRGDYLFVFSTDLSHYHPYDDAKNIDLRTLGAILGETPQAVDRLFEGGVVEACGRGPIVASLLLAAKLGHPERFLLAAANSGDTAGDRSRVVGYGTVVMADRPPAAESRLSSEAGAALVKAARLTLDMQLNPAKYKDRLVPLGLEGHPELAQSTGLFVTLRKRGQLRGCIGRIE
ncbi:MAG: AmmeMemoRadiSam system protein B, partial [Candidatus Omnitrophica bacterium]|nr:AmmeMemoRadiSam system protein B [Candidatus Omnitrophota bacterium]